MGSSGSGNPRKKKKGKLTLRSIRGKLPAPDRNTMVTVVNLKADSTKLSSKKKLKVKPRKLSEKQQQELLEKLLDRGKGQTGERSDPTGGLKKARKLDERKIARKEFRPVTDETRWKCLRCGWCCRQGWRVNMTWKEYDRLKDVLPVEEAVVDPASGLSHPFMQIKDRCVMLNDRTNLCTIRGKWPYTCEVFPFNLTMDGELIHSIHCKGFGHGKVVDREKWIRKIQKARKKAGMPVPEDYA